MLRVFVALGKQMPKNKAMIEDTEGVAKLLAKYNCTLVQGGARMGLMGVVVEQFQKYSDEVVMIVPEVHKSDLEGTISKESYIVEGESDRLKITINTCDMIIVLPGGTGTLAELSYYNETKKSGENKAKVVVVNTKGFYDKLFNFYKHQVKMGFMKKEHITFDVVNTSSQLEPILQHLITQKQAQIQENELKKSKEVDMKEVKKTKEQTKKEVKPAKAPAKKAEAKAPAKKVATKSTAKKVEVKPVEKKAPAKAPAKASTKKVEVKAPVKAEAKKAPAKKPVAKKVEAKPAAKKAAPKAPAKAPAKKVEAKSTKKAEAKPAVKKVAAKPAAKKAPAKAADKKTPAKKSTKKAK